MLRQCGGHGLDKRKGQPERLPFRDFQRVLDAPVKQTENIRDDQKLSITLHNAADSRESGTENVGLEPMRLSPAFALDGRVQYPHW